MITGAGHGIGKAYATAFVERGATVIVADIDIEAATLAATELGPKAHAIQVDVGDEASVAALFEIIEKRWGYLDHLVNNAAIMLQVEKPFKPFWELNMEEWLRVMNVNAAGVFLCCKYARPLMMARGAGRVVNVTSDGIWNGYTDQLAYFASKGAVAVMTRCLARELGEFNINVNAVAPGLTSSAAVNNSPFLQEVKPAAIALRALKRDQYPEDVAGAVVFLCSPDSGAITGHTIVINSGGIMP